MKKLVYSYTEDQVRVFPPSLDSSIIVDDFITKLDVWSSRKLRELDVNEETID